MQVPRHSIFRDRALKHYAQGRKKDILPYFGSFPVAVFFWTLIALLSATGLLAVYAQVPVYLTGTGIVLNAGSHVQAGRSVPAPAALAFFQPGTSTKLHRGLPVEIQFGSSGHQLTSSITAVASRQISPAAALAHYGIKIGASSLSSEPAVIVLISLGANFPLALYTGSALSIEVKIGTQSLFTSLAGVGNATGE